MRFAYFDVNGRVSEAHNDETLMEVPGGAFELSESQWTNRFALALVDGHLVDMGLPELEPEPVEEIRKGALDEIRAQRGPILTVLAGIGYDALVDNDNVTTQFVAQARTDLKAITEWPAFLAATTYGDMKAAIMARYREIADAMPENVKIAFREILG